MDIDISVKISKEWGVTEKEINEYLDFFSEIIRPVIRSNYLSHLVTTVDKNKFYTEECKKFVSKSDFEIFDDIKNTCPL
jgi:hypothetical protein